MPGTKHRRHPKSHKGSGKRTRPFFYLVCVLAVAQLILVLYLEFGQKEPGPSIPPPRPSVPGSGPLSTPSPQATRRTPGSGIPTTGSSASMKMLQDCMVYGVSVGKVKLAENSDIEVLGENKIARKDWALIRFKQDGRTLTGWVPSEAIAWPQNFDRVLLMTYDDVLKRELRATPTAVDTDVDLGLSRNEVIAALQQHFPDLQERLAGEGKPVRFVSRATNGDSLLMMQANGERMSEIILSVLPQDDVLVEALASILRGHCDLGAEVMTRLFKGSEDGQVDCGELLVIRVSHVSDMVWIRLTPKAREPEQVGPWGQRLPAPASPTRIPVVNGH